MDNFLSKLLENFEFIKQDWQWKNLNTKIYINEKSETYILVFVDRLDDKLPSDIFSLCADELHTSDKLTQAQKSNLSIIIVTKIENKLSDIQKNIIYKIEESDLYYKKFVLWYSEEELKCMLAIVGNDYTPYSINNILVNKNLFERFKKCQEDNKGYSLLSRIYIKLPFLTLNELETLDKTLSEYIRESLNQLNLQLFEVITDHIDDSKVIDDSINLIELSKNELSAIERELKEMEGTYESK